MPLPPRSAPLPPGTRAIADALGASEVLGSLGRRIAESDARLRCLLPLLPVAMRGALRAGPLDDAGWTLLATSQAVCVKLRHLLPALQVQLRQHGFDERPIRLKLLPR